MVQRMGGKRRKSRYSMTKEYSLRGKLNITAFFQKFNDGDRVVVKLDPTYQDGNSIPRRFFGKSGDIVGMQGDCYKIAFSDLGKPKMLIVHPIHLKKVGIV